MTLISTQGGNAEKKAISKLRDTEAERDQNSWRKERKTKKNLKPETRNECDLVHYTAAMMKSGGASLKRLGT